MPFLLKIRILNIEEKLIQSMMFPIKSRFLFSSNVKLIIFNLNLLKTKFLFKKLQKEFLMKISILIIILKYFILSKCII
ncbi:hypothetical protein BSA171_07315 [Bacillus safensis]|nr:hypothetical protein BSA171_07315 [Bacillus safensis]